MSVFGLAALNEEPAAVTVPLRRRPVSVFLARDDPEKNEVRIDLAEVRGEAELEDDNAKENIGQLATKLLGSLVLWLPGEVIAGYAAVVAMSQPSEEGAPPFVDPVAWWVSLAVTPLLLWLVALAGKKVKLTKKLKRLLTWRVVLSVPAFALWSASVPYSPWTVWFDTSLPLFWYGIYLATALFTIAASMLSGIKPKEQ